MMVSFSDAYMRRSVKLVDMAMVANIILEFRILFEEELKSIWKTH